MVRKAPSTEVRTPIRTLIKMKAYAEEHGCPARIENGSLIVDFPISFSTPDVQIVYSFSELRRWLGY